MMTAELTYSPEVVRLIECKDEMVHAADIAPIVKMHPDRIREYARNGEWPREVCNYICSNNDVKFFRIDFLKKGGWI
jgi:hypothetical protein